MKKILATGIALLPMLCGAGVHAADEVVTGSVSLGGISADVSGSEAKYGEYGDPDSTVTGGIEMRYSGSTGFVDFTADDIARDIQRYLFNAGQYGKFKLDAFYTETPHNLTFDARSYFTGVGTDTLATTATSASLPTNAAVWPSTFDYAVTRDQYGAGVRLDWMKPFFADFSISRTDQSGIRPAGTYIGVSTELPEPVDYRTNTFKAEIGYGEDPFYASLSYLASTFDNDNPYLYFPSLSASNTSEFLSLPPDNTYSKLAFNGRIKLPLKSTLAVNLGKSQAESDMNLLSAYNTTGATRTNILSDTIFDGKVDTTNYNVVLTSNPLSFLDGKIFYSGYDKENKSDEITSSVTSTTSTGTTTTTFDNHLFDYEKQSYGIEAGFKLPAHVKVTPYYKNVDVERHRGDFPETDDDIYGLKVKWSPLDTVALKAGYERMSRESPWHQLTLVTGTQATADAIEQYIRRFDAADQDRDTFKLGADFSPNDRLNIGLGYTHKQSDYDETIFGLLEKESNGFNINADLAVTDSVSFAAYLDYEVASIDQRQRAFTTATAASPNDTTVGDGNYNWTANQDDKTLDYGVSVDVAVVPKTLSIRAQFDHIRSNGFADFTYYESVPSGYTNDTVDSDNRDDYTRNSFMIKAIYEATKNVTLIGGYAYEDYEFDDQFIDGYSYVWNSSATATNYLTGAGMDPDYTANVFFLTAKYKF
ncbi:MAG: MtrB/PioB family decaheme-associated outer membrane protein [Thermodesulfobacteriota bacterium]